MGLSSCPKHCVLIALLHCSVLISICSAEVTETESYFTYQKLMVPMRDGVKLETVIIRPRNEHGPLPILLSRTPYGVPSAEAIAGYSPAPDDLAAIDPYILVFQNIRGRFGSEGDFEMFRPPHSLTDHKAVDEVTDAWDTIDWLIKNIVNNNRRVGIVGGSYSAWLVMQASFHPHPALVAGIEEASPDDLFLNDDFHHNGAFRLGYGFEYSALLETSKTENHTFQFDRGDTYEWYLGLGVLKNVDATYFHGKVPTWENFLNHPNRDSFWLERAITTYLSEPKIPIIHVAGWWDQEDMVGPQRIYSTLEKRDVRHLNYFVAGPWNHGQWHGVGMSLGPIQFGSDTSREYREHISAKWLAYWLYGKGEGKFPEAEVFQTGSNRWQRYDAWPPKEGITPKHLYLQPGGKMSFDPPRADSKPYDEYISDPTNPVPYRPRPITPILFGADWPVWLVQDQKFVDHRMDVLSFTTEPLDKDLTITGNIFAELFSSTSGTDSDWIVKLIDVCPSDATYNSAARQPMSEFQLVVNAEILRARFRANMEKPEAVAANAPVKYLIDLHGNDHVFRKKHRIMVQVQSTWFPLYDRNPQHFIPNMYLTDREDYQKAVQRVYHSSARPSAVILPVNTASIMPPETPDSCYPPVRFTEKIDPAALESYAGTYQTKKAEFVVLFQGNQLWLSLDKQKLPLTALSAAVFYSEQADLEFTFAADREGKVRTVATRNLSNPNDIDVAYRMQK